MIPMLLHLKIFKHNEKTVSLWLPLFLVWLLVIPLLLLVFPLILIASLILWPKGLGSVPLLVYGWIFVILGALSGLQIELGDKAKTVGLTFK